jgi:hypothetical protein
MSDRIRASNLMQKGFTADATGRLKLAGHVKRQGADTAHMMSMTPLRDEAQNPETAPERLHELIHLAGNRGDCDGDAGWCREYVAANPSAAPETLRELATDQDDTMARFNAARNPSLDDGLLKLLAEDRLDFIANAARQRLGMPLRPQPVLRVRGVPAFDATGRITR